METIVGLTEVAIVESYTFRPQDNLNDKLKDKLNDKSNKFILMILGY